MDNDDVAARYYYKKLAKARRLLMAWAKSAGFEVVDNADILEVIVSMRNQHCDERSYADLRASGGIMIAEEGE